jgi:hypothetical protein
MKVHEASLSSDLQGSILKPAEQTGWGVVVLAGSSGRVDVARAKLFAGRGLYASPFVTSVVRDSHLESVKFR